MSSYLESYKGMMMCEASSTDNSWLKSLRWCMIAMNPTDRKAGPWMLSVTNSP